MQGKQSAENKKGQPKRFFGSFMLIIVIMMGLQINLFRFNSVNSEHSIIFVEIKHPKIT
jgi:hypothetical protein